MVMCPLVLEIARPVVPECVSAALFTDISKVPATLTLSAVRVIRSGSPVLPIWSPVNRTDSTSTCCALDIARPPVDPLCVSVAVSPSISKSPFIVTFPLLE